ncbi:MAG TPA: rod shape-determining protein [Gaiellaceae bacterium]|jgi:rod shape-determining protein MreB|nr:rod shape-determining protein [Gaiellaceae bacterium]
MPWTRLRRLGPERQLAVDLGTANTVVYQPGKGVIAFEPSVVAVDERSGEVYAVGAEARRMIGRTPAHITATRPLRHGVIADFEMTEQMLRYFIRSASRRIGASAEVMVCIPSGVTQVERTAVEEATIGAGAARAYLIEEPLAAAIGAGLPVAESVGSLVVDIGGGTSEMAVTALGGMVVSHSVRVGGYDLDEAIVKLLTDTHRLLIGQEQAEAVKLEIGAARAVAGAPATAEVAGRDLTTGLLRRATVDADAVVAALQRPLDQILEGLELVLERTPPELAADIADRGLMLVGGGALLRELDALIRSRTGLAVTKSEDPLTTVALGAGLALEDVDKLPLAHARRGRRRRRA